MLLEKDIHIPRQEVQDFCEQMESAPKTWNSALYAEFSEYTNFLKC